MNNGLKKKMLIVTTVSGFVPQFEMNNVKILQKMGYEVHYAANYTMPVYDKDNHRLDHTNIIRHQIDFVRSPFRLQNIKAYIQLKKLMEKQQFDFVHCHTPMGGVIARIAAKRTKMSPVIYTAHGFHFYKGAPLFNWLLFYPIEYILANFTDILITINKEDYKRAKTFHVRKGGKVLFINGIGLPPLKQIVIDSNLKREKLGISKDNFVLVSIGELTKRKNHKVVIKALSKLKDKNICYIICGSGELEKELKDIIKEYHLERQVIMLGYRTDIQEILIASDCFIFPSKQEGLSVALMEAMQVGLPVICSNIRGNIDLIHEGKGGYLVEPNNEMEYAKAIKNIQNSNRKKMSQYNLERIKKFEIEKVEKVMKKVYKKIEEEKF